MKDFLSLFPANDFSLIAVVMALPLLGAFVNGVFGRRLGKDAVRLMTLAVTGVSFAAAIATFIALDGAVAATKTVEMVTENGVAHEVIKHGHAKLVWTAWEWMRTSGIRDVSIPIELKFSVDALSGVMMLVVTGVGFLIHVYATSYMEKDKGYWRFFCYLNLFVFSMLVLILADNLPVLFIGWEGVGLCSYLLIGFWYDKTPNAAAGKKAFIANRIGDFGLLCGMFLLVYYTGALDWTGIANGAQNLVSPADAAQVHLWPIGGGQFQDASLGGLRVPLSWLQPNKAWTITGATAVSVALFLGCTGKSAQLPLYVWLPDAMAGPTPVSALIHAATMVTAGVYLICRLSFVFVLSPPVMMMIAFTGALTALFAACLALIQNDIKRVLAYSTVSQLGFMFLGVGVGAFTAGFFHVFTHAFFKACLFLGAGSVIHAVHVRIHDDDRAQDMRNMGGLRKFMPLTFGTFVASTLAIIGFPLTSGFFSKDEILAHALVNTPVNPYADRLTARHIDVWQAPGWMNWVLWGMGVLAATLTAFYMCRAVFMTFFGEFRGWTIGRPSQLLSKSGAAKAAGHAEHEDAEDGEHGHGDGDDDHHHEEDLSVPGPPPAESPRAITIPLIILGTAAIVAGLFNPGMIKMISPHFDFLPMDHWLEPVFEEASKGVHLAVADEHVAHSREWISTVAAFLAFAVGTYVAYWAYIVQKGKHEAAYMSGATKLAAGFSGVIFVVVGGLILGVNAKEAFTAHMIVPWALVLGGIWLAYHCVKERAVGLDYVYDRSIVVGVDALADTAASVDQGLVDFIIARLSALIVAALGTLLRVVQNGVVHVYAAMMVLGLAITGWFFVQPHADATVSDVGNGDYVVNAAPGTGYSYRWYPDANGKPQNEKFGPSDSLKVHLDEGTSKTVKVEVKNAFSNALDVPLVRWIFPPTPAKEVTMTRPKVEKPVKLELGER
ncbi:MAG: NADH-ubiquinone oxidoreductase chain [Myxococcaceae bacterium]|nr:NADH-ubiquinone oxidoreductase chain [Myxococcaceae bacterium]